MGEDALDHLTIDEKQKQVLYDDAKVKVIYTGAIDELFNYKFGVLPYRSLRFDFKTYEKDSFQNVAIVAYPQEKYFTRITEYTKMPFQNTNSCTTVAYEYPLPYRKGKESGEEPYYPVLTEESQKVYQAYKDYAERQNLKLYLQW